MASLRSTDMAFLSLPAKWNSYRSTLSGLGICFMEEKGMQDALQCATPLHLRAQLSGTAYEAVRKLDHSKLRTKDENGKATDEGMKLSLKCLQDSLAQEAPVRTQELFLEYFCSPQVWRKNLESMAQHIIRRELAFAKLRESSTETQPSDNPKCMLLLIFSGLDLKEQQGILASFSFSEQ